MTEPQSPFHRDREDRIDPTGSPTERPHRRTGPDPSELRTAGQRPDSRRGDADPAPGRGRGTVVGIDGSAASRAALRWAAHRVEPTDAPIRAVAVWNQPARFDSSVMITDAGIEQEAPGWLRDALTDLPDVAVTTAIEHGDPAQVLLGYADEADLLVLGNHGHGAWSGALLGSVAQRCAHRARCPVVLVPAPDAPS